jgi:DNA-directed RNA polymerase specialized sigma54-like protein
MALLQPKLNLKVSQRQILTPGLMQMVSVLALNKLELKEMIDAEMVENPVLEEIDESVPMLDEVAGREDATRWSAGVEDKGARSPRPRPRILSTRSISDRTSRIIWTPAIARSRSMKRAKSPRLRTFSPSLRLCPITWRGSWEL